MPTKTSYGFHLIDNSDLLGKCLRSPRKSIHNLNIPIFTVRLNSVTGMSNFISNGFFFSSSTRTMSVQFNNLALMTLNDWQQGYFILMARAWTLHTWTKSINMKLYLITFPRKLKIMARST